MKVEVPRKRSKVVRVIKFVILLYVLWLGTLFFLQRSILFPRSMVNGRYAPPPQRVEIWHEARPDGITADAWFVPAVGASPSPSIVLLHGNAMLAGDWLDWAEDLSRRGVHVLIPEFRGYGISEGSPSREALVGDAAAMIERLVKDPRVKPGAIVVYGRSIGGAIAAEAAAAMANPPASLILHTAPSRLGDFAWRYGAPPFLVRDAFDTQAAVTTLRDRVAITVIGHDNDEVVSLANAERLAKAAGVPLIALHGTHNGFDGAEDERAFERSVNSVIATTAGRGTRR